MFQVVLKVLNLTLDSGVFSVKIIVTFPTLVKNLGQKNYIGTKFWLNVVAKIAFAFITNQLIVITIVFAKMLVVIEKISILLFYVSLTISILIILIFQAILATIFSAKLKMENHLL